ncbi:MAG: UbiD family decarboxylase, partial [Deltaproteobacteria bacterium]|nr:UbiD family decarboxylase [Deltaproteobacteria bacterium]
MGKDFRGYIDQLDRAGELIHVTREVDPDRNMGVLCWHAQDKAVLFEAIAGHPGWRALGQAPANFRQLALALGLPEKSLVLDLARVLERPGIKPQAVSSAPCKEVIWTGDQVDLRKIPVHVHSQRDGGRFIAGGIGVVKDPDTGVYNMSYHRMMITGRTRTGFMMVPRHAWQVLQKYEARGEPMPVAVAIGNHPAILLAASLTGTFEMDEMEIAGTLLGSPLPTVACETLDLMVPADSEIVLEGLIPPGVREQEGPFGE